MLRLMGLPPASRFPDLVLTRKATSFVLRFSGTGGATTMEIPLWALEGEDVEAAQLRLLVELRQQGYRVALEA